MIVTRRALLSLLCSLPFARRLVARPAPVVPALSNPALIALDILRLSGWKDSEIDLASFTTAADYCAFVSYAFEDATQSFDALDTVCRAADAHLEMTGDHRLAFAFNRQLEINIGQQD